MPHFVKVLRTKFGNPEFIFTEIRCPGGVRYHVLVVDESHKTCAFTMVVKSGSWQIIHAPLPPQWIVELEPELAQAITEHQPIS